MDGAGSKGGAGSGAVQRRAGRLPLLQMTRQRIDHSQEISLNENKQ